MTTITYISAIRYHQPIWGIEHLRKCLNYSYLRDDIGRHHGVNYNASDALKFAVMYDHLDYAKFLLENHLEEALDGNLCCPVILLAVQHGCKEMVELLCSFANGAGTMHKGRPYIDSCGCEAMENKKTPLHISAELGNEEITQILLQFGADVTVRDKEGLTPLERVIKRSMNVSENFPNTRTLRRGFPQTDRPTRYTLPRNRSRSRSPVMRTSSSESEPKYRAFDRSWHSIQLLLSCQTSMENTTLQNYAELCNRRFGDFAEEELGSKIPFSLMHHARLAIRSATGRTRLPDAIYDLGLPYRLERYVDLNPMIMEVTI